MAPFPRVARRLLVLALLAFLQCVLREGLGLPGKPIKAVAVGFIAAVTMSPRYAPDETGTLHTRDVTLKGRQPLRPNLCAVCWLAGA